LESTLRTLRSWGLLDYFYLLLVLLFSYI